MIRVLTCLLALLPIVLADAWLSQGPHRRTGYHESLARRLRERPEAKVAILGQSTIDQWLRESNRLAKLLHRPANDVVNASMGNCDYVCAFTIARHLLAQRRHFEEIYFGGNLYQMCEESVSWRQQTPLALIPRADLPALLALYSHAQQPLAYYARMVGMTVSDAYYDSGSVREWLRIKLAVPEARKGGPELMWARRMTARVGWLPSCTYAPEQIGLQSAALEALMADMARLADRVYYLALPDRRAEDPAYAGAWRAFVAHHGAVARATPRTTFIDLTKGGATAYTDFRDGAHLSAAGKKKQTALLQRKLAQLKKAKTR